MPSAHDATSALEIFLQGHAAVEVPHLFPAGAVLGSWELVAFLGRGGSAEVYRARHVQLDVWGAVKVLLGNDVTMVERFRREARFLIENTSPMFPRFLDFGEADGRSYLVIEFLEPLELPKEDESVAEYLLQVCEGIAQLHRVGLVHRDIKPQNVMRRGTATTPVIIDLGLMKHVGVQMLQECASLSIVDGKAVGVGTPAYSAPEQFVGGAISPTADVHALGMLAHACFDGKPPTCWARIIRRATCSIPEERYASVAALMRAIRRRHLFRSVVAAACLVSAACLALLLVGVKSPRGGEPVPKSAQEIPPQDISEEKDYVPQESKFPETNGAGKRTMAIASTSAVHQGLLRSTMSGTWFMPDRGGEAEDSFEKKEKGAYEKSGSR